MSNPTPQPAPVQSDGLTQALELLIDNFGALGVENLIDYMEAHGAGVVPMMRRRLVSILFLRSPRGMAGRR